MDAQGSPDRASRSMTVVRARGDDWAALREVRLAALGESPSAFGSTWARESQYDEARWRDWTTSAAVFLLVDSGDDGEPRGLAAGLPVGAGDVRQVVAVWVCPASRGRGGADLLLEAVEGWARHDGAHRLELWLTRGNVRARGLYLRRGFVETGRSKPLPSNPDLIEDEMAVLLT